MNKVTLIGRLTRDPDLKYLATTNIAVCNFTLAVNRKYKKDKGQQADFIPCEAWDNQAENICKYLRKGSQIGVSGRIQTKSWDDSEGKRHFLTQVVVEEAEFLGGKKEEPVPEANINQYQGYDDFPDEANLDEDELPF